MKINEITNVQTNRLLEDAIAASKKWETTLGEGKAGFCVRPGVRFL